MRFGSFGRAGLLGTASRRPAAPPASDPLAFTGNQPPPVRAFAPYSYTPLVTGGTAPYLVSTDITLPDGWSMDPETGLQSSDEPTLDLPGAQMMTVMDSTGATATLAVNAMTLGPSITPVKNNTFGRTGMAVAAASPVEYQVAREQVLFVSYVRINNAVPNSRMIFSVGSSSTPNNAFSLRATEGNMFAALGNGSTVQRSFPAATGTWLQVIAQLTFQTNTGRASIADRCRVWVNAVKQPDPASFGAAFQHVGTTPFVVNINGISTSVPDVSHGYHWAWYGRVADLPLIDFDDPAIRDQFDFRNIPPAGSAAPGQIDFGGAVGLVRPHLFYHGDAALHNGTLPNLGTWGDGFDLDKIAGTFTDTDFTSERVILGDPTVVNQSVLSQGNVTFEMDVARPTGQFEDESWWVDISGGATSIVADLPLSRQADLPWRDAAGTSGLQWVDGLVHNPTSDAKIAEGVYYGPLQGWSEGPVPALSNYQTAYNHAYNISAGKTGAPVLMAPGSYVKAIVDKALTRGAGTSDAGRYRVKEMRSIMALNGQPPTADLYFNPGFSGRTPYIWIKADGTAVDIDMFPNLSTAGLASVPSFFQVYTPLARFQTSSFTANHGPSSSFAGPLNYGREHSRMTGSAGLAMCLNHLTLDEKRHIANAFVRYAIQLADFIEGGSDNSGTGGWGNTSSGRKLALMIGAMVTNNARLLDALADATTSKDFFVEDQQIFEITPDFPDIEGLFVGRTGGGGGEWSGGGSPLFYDGSWDRGYRGNWASGQHAHNNLLHLIPALATLNANNLYRNYMDFHWAYERSRVPPWPGEASDRMDVPGVLSFIRTVREVHGAAWVNIGPMGGL